MTFDKRPADDLDYLIDWTRWLEGDTIVSSTWTVPTGITSHDKIINSGNQKTTVWLSGGTLGSSYVITNVIVTTVGRTKEITFTVTITNFLT